MSEFQIYSSPGSNTRRSALSPNRSVNQHSPIREDIHFYARKAARLEEDVMCIGDELNKARLRLRRAEDFQYKYENIFKQKIALEEELACKDKEINDLVKENETLKLKMKDKGEKNNENLFEKERLLKDIEIWKEKAIQAEQKAQLAVSQEQTKAKQIMDRQLAIIKKRFAEAQQENKYQIARLSKQLEQKQTTDSSTHTRQQKQSKQKEKEIARLEEVIQKMRDDYRSMLDEKNEEILKVKDKFQNLMTGQLQNLHKNITNQDQKFKIQLQGLKTLIDLKNKDISNLQQQLKINLEDHAKVRKELNEQIQHLKLKINQQERQSEEQLFNMKQRLTSLHAADVQAMNKHYDELIDNLKEERQELNKLMTEKDKTVQYQRKQNQRRIEQLKKIIQERDKYIDDLKQKLALTGQSSSSQIGTLQKTLNKYADEKEAMSSEYQSNIAFLNQQITKLAASNDLKNNQIKQLHQYIAMLKKDHFESIKELESKWRQQRKERQQQREKQRDLRQKVEEQFRQNEKHWKNKQRELEMECEKEKRQKTKWAIGHEKLEKQVQRLYNELNLLEENCRNQFNKNQSSVIQGGGSKRQLVGELERQKGEFEALKRMQVDQVRKKYELEIIRLTNSNQRLHNELSAKKIDYQKLEDEFKKVSSQYKNIEKINKEKMADYQKKMNAINSEILMTQNLYQSLIGAKSKVAKKQQQ